MNCFFIFVFQTLSFSCLQSCSILKFIFLFIRIGHILNVTREIDNFFPGMFDYQNIRVYDDESTEILHYWDKTYRYIRRAK